MYQYIFTTQLIGYEDNLIDSLYFIYIYVNINNSNNICNNKQIA